MTLDPLYVLSGALCVLAEGFFIGWTFCRERCDARHAAERTDLLARIQAGSLAQYDSHVAREEARAEGPVRSPARPHTPPPPLPEPPGLESLAEGRVEFGRLMSE